MSEKDRVEVRGSESEVEGSGSKVLRFDDRADNTGL